MNPEKWEDKEKENDDISILRKEFRERLHSSNYRDVTVCGIPYRLIIAENGAIFSNKSGFWGVESRLMFEYVNLWYLVEIQSTLKGIPVCHIVKMYKILKEYIGCDHHNFAFTFKK